MSKFDDLMEKLKISAVYWIDDENAQGAEVDLEKSSATYVDALLAVEADERRRALAPLLSREAFRQRANNILRIASAEGEDIQSKADRIAPVLRQVLEESPDQIEMLRNLREKLPGPLPPEQRNALVQLFMNDGHESWRWAPLSFTQWQEQGPAVLHEHTPDHPALFIIDLQNTSEVTPVDGKTVLSQVAQAEIDRQSCHLVVLTSECKEKEEYKRGRQLTEEIFNQHQDRRVPVFALSKHRFAARAGAGAGAGAGNEDVSPAFESVLERANLSLLHLNLTRRIRSHFVSSIDSAFNALDRLTIEELMYAVTHTSKKEGVPEIDTLIRLTSIAQREALQKAIVEEVELRDAILALRQSELSIEKDQLEIDDEITAMRSAELYDRAEVVNPLYSALSPGDLFVVERRNEIGE